MIYIIYYQGTFDWSNIKDVLLYIFSSYHILHMIFGIKAMKIVLHNNALYYVVITCYVIIMTSFLTQSI